jgi:hypothetical protein
MHLKKIKNLIYKVLFGKNYKNKSEDIFINLFPSIYKFIKNYKTKNGNYKILSHKLQKYESNLIYNKIIREILDTYPQIRMITVHDSIIFPIKYKKEVEIIFNEKLKQEFTI